MIRCVLLVLVLAPTGCDRVFGLSRPPDAPEQPDALDAFVAPVDAQRCFGSGSLALCLAEDPPERFVVELGTTTTIDTSPSAPLCVAYTDGEPDVCVVGVSILQVEGILQAVGSRPLVLAAATVTITGIVSVASTSNPAVIGASSSPTDCVSGSPAGGPGGGGAGGSFGGRGGNGGVGSGIASGGTAGPATAMVTRLRGGCQGRLGEGSAGLVARGGGAVAILASSVMLDGRVTASGAGGFGGTGTSGINGNGGGGGGSGGMIVIDAVSFAIGPSAAVFANGGGGGEGGGTPSQGVRGADATDPNVAAAGGDGGTASGGGGGSGSVGAELDGRNGRGGTSNAGGGGGAGGAGVIRFVTPPTGGGTVSPAPS